MNALLSITPSHENQPTMSSKEIAELTEKRHDHVKRDIDKMFKELSEGSPKLGTFKNERNQTVKSYELSKEETYLLVSGYSVVLRSKIIKRWFELEKTQSLNIPQNFSEALQLAADQAKQLELQAPKVEFAETIQGSDSCVTMGEFAKLEGTYGRNTLFAILRENKILMKGNVPYQKWIIPGYFEVTEKETRHGMKTITLVTGKGQGWLAKKIKEWSDKE